MCASAQLEWIENVFLCAHEDRICHQVVRGFGSLRNTKFTDDLFEYRTHQVNLFLAKLRVLKKVVDWHPRSPDHQ